jgi:hypothetical protein
MTGKEYKKIRKILISLICIGDKIHYIRSTKDDYFPAIFRNIIITYKVKKINDRFSLIIENNGSETLQFFSDIEHYNDKLYIWNAPLKFYTNNYDLNRLERNKHMASIINSKLTTHIGYQSDSITEYNPFGLRTY